LTIGFMRAANATVVAWLAACASAPAGDVGVVDVVVSAPENSSTASASATSVAVAAPERRAPVIDLDDDPRRVLVPPPLAPLPIGSLTPPSAGPISPTDQGALTTVLAQRIASDARGMTAEGPPLGGMFKQGDTLHLPLTLQSGRCYTFIAVSNSIGDIDIDLMFAAAAGSPLPPMAVARDAMAGPIAVIGAGGNCFKNPAPIPLPVIAVVRATTGSGPALAQPFSK
jgi:hypothetical protein